MDADGRRWMIKTDNKLNCFLHCDRAAMKETFSACRQQGVVLCPKGWILTGWYALSNRRSKNTLSGFISVHRRSSCKNAFFSIDNTAKMAAAKQFQPLFAYLLPCPFRLLPFTMFLSISQFPIPVAQCLLLLSPSASNLLPLTFYISPLTSNLSPFFSH